MGGRILSANFLRTSAVLLSSSWGTWMVMVRVCDVGSAIECCCLKREPPPVPVLARALGFRLAAHNALIFNHLFQRPSSIQETGSAALLSPLLLTLSLFGVSPVGADPPVLPPSYQRSTATSRSLAVLPRGSQTGGAGSKLGPRPLPRSFARPGLPLRSVQSVHPSHPESGSEDRRLLSLRRKVLPLTVHFNPAVALKQD